MPSAVPSASALPSPGGSPGSSPSPIASASPAPSPSGTSLASSSPSPVPSPSATAPGPTPTPIQLGAGRILGQDTVGEGDTASGGLGQPVDGIACEPEVTVYHVHSHVSLFVNGVRMAIPDVIGFVNPGPEIRGFTNTAKCVYHIHTHDADGYIHQEAPAPAQFTLGEVFDIWGEPLSSSDIAGFSGQVMAYTATAPTPGYNQTTGPYVPYTGDLRSLVLASHLEIVLEVGPPFVTPPSLPAVIFYTIR
ncbi:MAG: hypothetical protein GIW99_12600 [Candidatus Eremiobacteraeota bacterium]|nr:hypothetical protein [Candidatus Eremiobacteraeota bacterium]